MQAVGDLKPSFEEILKMTQRASAALAMRILGDAESVGDVLARFSGTRIAEIAQQRRAYLVEQGREAERAAEHERRSCAARRAAATRHGCRP